VQSIIRELRGEKIDIIEYNDDALIFAANALSPAKINHVSVLDMAEKHLEVIVDDTQLSLAIGKKGQNVRLAAKLLAWHIDIKSEEEKRQEIESQMAAMALRGAPISELKGLGDKTLAKLREHGIESVEQLSQMTPEDLMQIQGVGEKTVDRIRRVVTDYFERDEAGEAAAEAGPEVEAAGQDLEEAATPAVAPTPDAEAAAGSLVAEEASAPEEATGGEEATGPETAVESTPAPEESSQLADSSETIQTKTPEGEGEGESKDEPATSGEGGGGA
jgi:N utilization substance protein A